MLNIIDESFSSSNMNEFVTAFKKWWKRTDEESKYMDKETRAIGRRNGLDLDTVFESDIWQYIPEFKEQDIDDKFWDIIEFFDSHFTKNQYGNYNVDEIDRFVYGTN